MNAIDISLHLASPLVLLALIFVFFRRKLIVEFPVFFAYMLYSQLSSIARISVVHHPSPQFWIYWATEAAYGVFGLLVLNEVLRRLFSLAHEAHWWLRLLLPIGVILVIGFALVQTIYYPVIPGIPGRIPRATASIYWFDVGLHLLEGIILMLVLVLTAFFPVSWKRQEFGILAGFGVNASIAIIAFICRFELGKNYEAFFRYGQPLAYLAATVIWLHAFLGPLEPKHRPRMGVDELLGGLRGGRGLLEWIERILGLRRRDSLLPGRRL